MQSNKTNSLYDELLSLIESKGQIEIEELIKWAKEKGASNLVLSALLSELEEKKVVKLIGKWSKSEPLFPLPEKVEIAVSKTKEEKPKIEEKKEIIEGEEKLREYIAKYYSIGELRIRIDFDKKVKNIDYVLRKMEEEGLIIWDREIGVITATQKLLEQYKKVKSFTEVFS
jgi:hypothetical protein